MNANIFGINRLRINSDGPGIITLVGMYKCPLECEYCINNPISHYHKYTIEELFEEISIDSLYFNHVGGGVCFGGHEPLIQQDFIIEFIKYVKSKNLPWSFGMETSLNGKLKDELLEFLDFIIIDIKDINYETYKKYTGKDNSLVISNLKNISKIKNIMQTIRIPLIPGYNTTEDIEMSKQFLVDIGYSDDQFDIFAYETK